MFSIFKKNTDDGWLVSAKKLKSLREAKYKTLTREEIKEAILECERKTNGISERELVLSKCYIDKADYKSLKKLGYQVSITTERIDYTEYAPCVKIWW